VACQVEDDDEAGVDAGVNVKIDGASRGQREGYFAVNLNAQNE
jgi:hypothetical protein